LVVAGCGGDDVESTTQDTDATGTTVTAAGSKPTTSAAAKSTTSAAGGGYSFSATFVGPDVDEFGWQWTGSFSIEAGNVVGSGTVSGVSEGECGIEGGTYYPVAYTADGEFDITGTADDSTMALVLRPTNSNLDLTVGDVTQLCVELSVDAGQAMLELPLGDAEVAVLPIEVPRSGGITSLDFGDGFVIEVEVQAP
jgi:hypothetical protein